MAQPWERARTGSGSEWETKVGYSRAVRVGPFVAVAGTVAVDDANQVIGHGDPYLQAQAILEKIGRALGQVGARLDDVTRTRIFVTDIRHWQEVGRAHGEVFGAIRPAATMVEVSRLIGPEFLVEIEAEAVVAGSQPAT